MASTVLYVKWMTLVNVFKTDSTALIIWTNDTLTPWPPTSTLWKVLYDALENSITLHALSPSWKA